MLISIITPTLNSEEYIEDNLKSVHLYQNGDFQVEQIIVDGNSKDKTIEIIRSFKIKHNANITVIQGKDKSMYDAINKGMKKINGDIWACLNSDDQYNSEIFSIIKYEFSRYPKNDCIYGYIDHIDESGNFIRRLHLFNYDLKKLILCGDCSTIFQPASFLRRHVIEKVGYFDTKYKYAYDYDYFIRIGAKCKLKKINKSFTQFRVHKKSISYNENTAVLQRKESNIISKKYIDILNIKNNKISIIILKLNFALISIINRIYLLKCLIKP